MRCFATILCSPFFFQAVRSESIGRNASPHKKTSTSERLHICHQRPCRYKVARLRHAVICHDFMFPFFLQAFRRLYKNVRLCYSTPSPMSTQATYNILFSPLIGTSPNLGEELFGGSIPFY